VALGLAATAAAAPSQNPTITAQARADQPGELVVLDVTGLPEGSTVTARAFDATLPAFAVDGATWRVLVPIDLDVTPGRYAVRISTGATGSTPLLYDLAVTGKKFPTRTLKVDEAFVNPPAEAMAQIQEDAQDLQAVWSHPSAVRLWSGGFVRPVPQAANSAFGTRSVFNGQPRSPHSGADFLSPAGTPVKAPNDGRVVLAKALYYTGNTVVIDHGLGVFSLLAHLSAISVKTGDEVRAGDEVGLVGATGRVTGAHLHWTVRIGGARIDPLSLLATLGR
jgi:murein DD-endopeptidase MepM/ murein hydrolase activator NlpD